MTSRTLDERTGAQVFLKCENFQRVGAFKFRGAYNALSQLDAAQKRACHGQLAEALRVTGGTDATRGFEGATGWGRGRAY